MRTSYAWLTILGALIVGVIAANIFTRAATPVLQLGVTCLLLSEAEAAGHLTPEKRSELVAKVGQSSALQGKDREIALNLATGCPKKI
jgi:hypothetical protein